jgi:protease-4
MQPQYVVQPAPRGRGVSLGCLVAVVVGVAVCGLIGVAFLLLVVGSAVGSASYATSAYGGVQLQEIALEGRAGDPKVLVIPIGGLLIPGGLAGRDPAVVLKAMLRRASVDQDLRSVVLLIDSPGGGITTCDVMFKQLNDFRKQHPGVPVVSLFGDVAASGGYYVGCAADHIMAHRTTTTGSIGVLMPLYDISRLMQTFGVSDRTVTSAEFKNMGSPFAFKTDQQRKREAEIFQSLVDDMHARFVEVIAEGRGMPPEDVAKLATGQVYSASQALENGLIDSIGYEEDAIAKARELAGLRSARVVRYQRLRSLREMLLVRSEPSGPAAGLDALAQFAQTPRLMYLWCPQAAGSE